MTSASPTTPPARTAALAIAAILLAVLAAHGAMLWRGPVWDDLLYLRELDLTGRIGIFSPDLFGFVRPGKMALITALHALFGHAAWGYQAASLSALALAALLVWRFAREFLSPLPALAAALVYAVHPLHVEGAGWLAASNGTWMMIFSLLYYLVVLRDARSPRPALPPLATALFLAALLMKEDAVVVPILGLLWLCAAGLRPRRRALAGAAVQLALAALFVLYARTQATGAGQKLLSLPYPPWAISLAAPGTILAHLGYFVYPFFWAYYREIFVSRLLFITLLAAGWIIAIVAAEWILRRRQRLPFPAWAFLFTTLALLPTANLLPMGNDLFGVRYLTHPALGLSLLAGWALGATRRRRAAAWGAAALWLVACAAAANIYHQGWRTEQALFTHLAAVNRDPYYYQALSRFHYEHGDARAAEALARQALQINPNHTDSLVMLGMALARQGRAGEALALWQRASELAPDNCSAALNLADAYDTRYATTKAPADLTAADRYYRLASGTRLATGEAAFVSWGTLWAANGDLKRAVAIWETGLKRFPASKDLAHNLALARRQTGKTRSQ